MFISGKLADRANLRIFIPLGLLGSCIGLMMWCLAYSYNIHSLMWFIVANIISGVFQSIGWPSTLAIVGNWVQGNGRGLIMGLWNINTYFGNIVGSMVGGLVLNSDAKIPWPYVFFYLSFLGICVSMFFL